MPLTLERDLPADAPPRRDLSPAPPAEVTPLEPYFRFLRNFPAVAPAVLRGKRGPSGAPFRLWGPDDGDQETISAAPMPE
jgi:hypothetical protein